jgi:hypothetical protein
MTPGTSTKRTFRLAPVIGRVALATTAVALLLTGTTALANKPSNSSPAATVGLSGDPSFAGVANFAVSYSPSKWVQEMSVTCSVNGQQVLLDVHTQSMTAWTAFALWSQPWADAGGGAASCLTSLYYYTWQGHTETGVVYEAETSFVTT